MGALPPSPLATPPRYFRPKEAENRGSLQENAKNGEDHCGDGHGGEDERQRQEQTFLDDAISIGSPTVKHSFQSAANDGEERKAEGEFQYRFRCHTRLGLRVHEGPDLLYAEEWLRDAWDKAFELQRRIRHG